MSFSNKGKEKASNSSSKKSNRDEAKKLLPTKDQRERFEKFFRTETLLAPRYNKRDFYYIISRILENEFIQKRQRLVGGSPERNSWSAGILTIDDKLIHYFLACVNWPYVILNHLAIHNEFACGLPYSYWLSYVLKKNNLNLIGEKVSQIGPPDNEITPKGVCNAKTRVNKDPRARTISYINPSQA
ncbi:hypothetical protein KIW84_010447 [Lathyrus oleraceus]|uniref:Uncharacterized protein n=1 Tax=Pisum sativum TaxID=3888 RepID=A0A9D4YKX6_PEA|nr:hypothetical protein KIW84_010447 [Pisum sativum]